MRAWVFPEDKIEPALERWASTMGTLMGRQDIDMLVAGVRDFLYSEAALKLRVKECEPVEDEHAAG